jgi:folate-binding protein YgfZ
MSATSPDPTSSSLPARQFPNPLLGLHTAVEAEMQPYETLEIVSTFGEPQAEYAAIHKSCGLMDMVHRGVLEVTGKDRLPFLNNLLTNECWSKTTKAGLTAGQGMYAFLIATNGRLIADMNVIERGDRTFLETDARMVDSLRKALDRYLFGEQVKLVDRIGSLHEIGLHGPNAPGIVADLAGAAPPELPALGSTSIRIGDVEITVFRDDICGVPGLHLLVPSASAPTIWKTLVDRYGQLIAHARRPLRPIGWAAFNTVRIEAGRPLFGVDFDSSVLPAEVGPETFSRAVSVTKGCYPGQEVVARMYARKQWARQLVGLKIAGDALPMAGSPVYDEAQNQVGGITSSTISPLVARTPICFGFVKKPFAADGKTVLAPAEGAMRQATVSTTLRFLESPAATSKGIETHAAHGTLPGSTEQEVQAERHRPG